MTQIDMIMCTGVPCVAFCFSPCLAKFCRQGLFQFSLLLRWKTLDFGQANSTSASGRSRVAEVEIGRSRFDLNLNWPTVTFTTSTKNFISHSQFFSFFSLFLFFQLLCSFLLFGCAPSDCPPRTALPRTALPRTTVTGVSHDSQELQTCTFEGPGVSKHHRDSTRRAPERRKKEWHLWRGSERKARNFGPSGGGAVRGGRDVRGL